MGVRKLEYSEQRINEKKLLEAIQAILLSQIGLDVPPEDLARAQSTIVSAAGVEIKTQKSGTWQPGEWVDTGVERTNEGAAYVCLQAHCTQEEWQPKETPELWEEK